MPGLMKQQWSTEVTPEAQGVSTQGGKPQKGKALMALQALPKYFRE